MTGRLRQQEDRRPGARSAQLRIEQLSPLIGAEVHGLCLDEPLLPETVAAVRAALNAHHVLFFRGQQLTPGSQAAFARQFGEVTEGHPVERPLPEHGQVLAIDAQRGDRASWWHTDVTFLDNPPMASILCMREGPEVGGDTMWASLQDAYDRLHPGVRHLCDGLIAVHHDEWFADIVRQEGGYKWNGEWHESLLPAVHPVVRVHPENGRKGLFVNPHFTKLILGLSTVESDALLEMLARHATQPELTVRFRWEPGSVAFWDNRATMHYAIDDYGDARRLAHRVTLKGDKPVGPSAGP